MEHLIAAIRTADCTERGPLYEALYLENLPLLRAIVSRYRGMCSRDRSVDEEDLLQAGFLALVAAAQAYNPKRGKWSTLANFYVKRAIRSAIGIYHGTPGAPFDALSLDAPVTEGAGAAFVDMLEDHLQPEIDEPLLRAETADVIRSALSSLKDPSAIHVIQMVDINGLSYKEVERKLGISPRQAHSMRRAGLHELRRNPAVKNLADSYALDERTRFHRHKGVRQFQADWSSVTEDAVLWRLNEAKYSPDP